MKHRKISIFFESFVIDRRAGLEAQAAVRELKIENAQLKSRLEALERAVAGAAKVSKAD